VNFVSEEKIEGKYPLRICDCGIRNYEEVLRLQHQLTEQRKLDKIPNTILIVEHTAVITLGARKNANTLLISREELLQKKINVVEIRRGGGTTAHNPGQLVFYPVLSLRQLNLGINEYIRLLEEIGIELLKQSGLTSTRIKGFPGLWVDERKIASIGVRVSRFITYHGMAININNDLGIFDYIVPCGLDNIEMTSVLKETGQVKSMDIEKKRLNLLLVRNFS
jgi:lipoyl(octanoyl) transferase